FFATAIFTRTKILAVTIIKARRVSIAARRRTFAFAGVGVARTRIGLLTIGFGAVGLARIGLGGVGPLLAVALAGEIALGEFLVGPACRAGAALAAGWPITPA